MWLKLCRAGLSLPAARSLRFGNNVLARAMATELAAKRAKTDGRRGLVERLSGGETVLCAEGYLLEFARMGYIAHGVWVPEFMLETPEILKTVHRMFVHAGSDVTEAFQYYTHREKMKQIGREKDLERINRTALRIAREIAMETNTLFAGGISQTNIYVEGDKKAEVAVRAMYEEQVQWSKEEGAEYIIAETLSYLGEAEIALEVIKSFDLPAVVTFAAASQKNSDGELETLDHVPLQTACRTLLDKGATLVGANCFRGPEGTLKVVKQILKECPAEKVCALPVAYRTKDETFFDLKDEDCPANNPVYPHGLEAFQIAQVEVSEFTKQCLDLGMQYLGICCGNSGNYTRAMAEAMGRTPPASQYRDPTNMGLNPVYVKEVLEK